MKHKTAWICGCGHSGTSIVARMLSVHPDVYVPHRETNLFLNEQDWQPEFDALIKEAQGRRLIEKSPPHTHYINFIRQVLPGAQFIIPVRDGRDVCASYKPRFGTVEDGIARWLKYNKIVAAQIHQPDVLVYKHEDLVARPEATLGRITGFLGLPYCPAMLKYHEQPQLWFGVEELRQGTGERGLEHLHLRNWQINQPLFDDSGEWRRLPQEDLHKLDKALNSGPGYELMKLFGYLE